MTTLTVNRNEATTLTEASGLVEIRDEFGRVIGFFAPISMELAEKYALAAAQLYPFKKNGTTDVRGNKTTAEMLAHLQTLEQAQ